MITIKQFATKAGSNTILKHEGFLYAPLKNSVNGAARVSLAQVQEDQRLHEDGAYLVQGGIVEYEGQEGNAYNNLIAWKDFFIATSANRRAMDIDPELLNNVAMARATDNSSSGYLRGVFIDGDRIVATNGHILNKAAITSQAEEPFIMSGIIADIAGKKSYLARVGNNATLLIKEGIEYIDTDINGTFPDYRKLYENINHGDAFESQNAPFIEGLKLTNKQLLVFDRAAGFEHSIYNVEKGRPAIKLSLLVKGTGAVHGKRGAINGATYNRKIKDCDHIRFTDHDDWAQKPFAFENKDFTNYTLIMGLRVDQLEQ